MNSLTSDIRNVWGGHDDFEEGGIPYVMWLIECDLDDIREAEDMREQASKELADIAINALRAIDELTGQEPETAVRHRLNSRMDGQTQDIIERYQARYESGVDLTDEEQLDIMISYWRDADEDYAEYYVDAIQSVRRNLIGSTLEEDR